MRFAPSLILLLVAASFSNCQKDTDPQADAGLTGSWRLVNRQCFCASSPLPNEILTFTANTFAFTYFAPRPSPHLFTSGTYQPAAITLCGLPSPRAGLRFTEATASLGSRDAEIAIRADTLVLDYGSPCDAARDTYVRQP